MKYSMEQFGEMIMSAVCAVIGLALLTITVSAIQTLCDLMLKGLYG